MARDTIASLRRERDAAKQELAKFRQEVWDVAMEAAEEHEMCGVVEETLAKVGLFPPKRTATVTIEIPDLEPVFERVHYAVGRDDEQNATDLAELIRDKAIGWDMSVSVTAEVSPA